MSRLDEAVALLRRMLEAPEGDKPPLLAYIGDDGAQCAFCGRFGGSPYDVKSADQWPHEDDCVVPAVRAFLAAHAAAPEPLPFVDEPEPRYRYESAWPAHFEEPDAAPSPDAVDGRLADSVRAALGGALDIVREVRGAASPEANGIALVIRVYDEHRIKAATS